VATADEEREHPLIDLIKVVGRLFGSVAIGVAVGFNEQMFGMNEQIR
jgi:hypothetical protein